jgi:ectoine hydroxylase-related dioxygenase (phytanoyl-CoA dioxygenase family)
MLSDRFDFDSEIFDISDVYSSLRRNGYAIIENSLSDSELNTLREEIQPHLDACEVEEANKFMGGRTKRFGRLLYRLPSAEGLVLNPLIRDPCEQFLLNYASTYQIHFTGVMHVMPGQTAQKLHRDNIPFGNPSPPLVLATMWAVTDFTKENGATVVIPGSHLWKEEREAREEEKVVAEMEAGSVLLYFGNLVHGAGANTAASVPWNSRTGLNIQYSVSWLRQEENQYLAVPRSHLSKLSERTVEILGYDLATRHWGYVDQVHPMKFIQDEENYGVGGIAPEGLNWDGKIRLDITENGVYPAPIEEKKDETVAQEKTGQPIVSCGGGGSSN